MTVSVEAAKRLEEIEERDGILRPAAVAADAEDLDSPLHDYFEWDDGKAATSWRLEQARDLIRKVRLVVTTETVSIKAPAYVKDPALSPGQSGYTPVIKLRKNEDAARLAIVAEFARVRDALSRARALAVALSLQGEIDGLLERVMHLRRHFDERPNGPFQ
ncbi:hypothetical protein ELH77_19010 [Rhizobium ruizarguesonis]|uniref:hypothetical protein n=1 Tax=Rhizobium ruizarguesonis TaxID=2081791 RepID=UPI0010326219|nr:hypothetical protein [Rhizobium ruizarguesonis]TAZ20697.1 hypothetical protein ELH77_19010 [Rhizobium ruizarguesonis]